MTDERLAEVMAYCRMDDSDEGERALCRSMIAGAESYLAAAGVVKPQEEDIRRHTYDLVVNALVLDDYDNRGTQTAGYQMEENPAFRRKLNQLKLTVPIQGTEV